MPTGFEPSGHRRIGSLLPAVLLAVVAVVLAASPLLVSMVDRPSHTSASGEISADATEMGRVPAVRSAASRPDFDRGRELDVLLPLAILVASACGLSFRSPRPSRDVGVLSRLLPFHGPVHASRAPPVLTLSFR